MASAMEDWEGLRRIRELRHPDCDPDWLLALQPAHGAFLPPGILLTVYVCDWGLDLWLPQWRVLLVQKAFCSHPAHARAAVPPENAPKATMLSEM